MDRATDFYSVGCGFESHRGCYMKQFPNSKVRHGTYSGWSRHIEANERPCTPCYNAKQQYDYRRREAPLVRLKSRLSATAQFRAYQRIAHQYPRLYAKLYKEERDRMFIEAGIESEIPKKKRKRST